MCFLVKVSFSLNTDNSFVLLILLWATIRGLQEQVNVLIWFKVVDNEVSQKDGYFKYK